MAATAPSPLETPSPGLDAARYQTFSRLVESLMHEVRNPLNALSIHLEVLTERLRAASGGELLPNQEKHLTAIRNQVQRVDVTLRSFAEFLLPPGETEEPFDFSDGLAKAMELLGHETRRGRVSFQAEVQPELIVRLRQRALSPFLTLQPLLRAVCRAKPGSTVSVRWMRRADGRGLLEVKDSGDGVEPFPTVMAGLQQACEAESLDLSVNAGTLSLLLPLRS